MTESVLSLLDGIAGLPLWALALAVALVVAAESSLLIGLIVPGDLIVLLAASGGGSAPRGAVLVVAVAAGSLAGEALGYAIGRRWGGRVRAGRFGRALGEHRWDRAGHALARHGGRAVFGARYVAAIHAVLPVAAGTLRMPVRKFLAWSAVGALSWAAIYVSVGAAAGASFREAGESLAGATLAVFGVAALAVTGVWFRNRHRRRSTPAVGRAAADRTTPATATPATATSGAMAATTATTAATTTAAASLAGTSGVGGGTDALPGGNGGNGCGNGAAAGGKGGPGGRVLGGTGGGTGGTGGSGVRVAAALASPTAGPCDGRHGRRAA